MVSVINAGLIHSRRRSVEDLIQEQVTGLIGKYGWMFLAGAAVLLFRSTIETSVAGLMIFMGNDYNEDDMLSFLSLLHWVFLNCVFHTFFVSPR